MLVRFEKNIQRLQTLEMTATEILIGLLFEQLDNYRSYGFGFIMASDSEGVINSATCPLWCFA